MVTERGLPVAKIVPLRGTQRTDSRRERLARAGVLQLGAVDVGAGVLKALLAEREEGR